MRRINDQESQPAVVYVHPWEMDPHQPRMAGSWRSRFRHYVNLDTTADKLRHLLERFSFGSMQDVFAGEIAKVGPLAGTTAAPLQAGSGKEQDIRRNGYPSCAA